MRAIRVDQFGRPEVLKLAEVMLPRPENGQAVTSVDAAGVNFADTQAPANEANPQQATPYDQILHRAGHDAAVIEAADIDGFPVGPADQIEIQNIGRFQLADGRTAGRGRVRRRRTVSPRQRNRWSTPHLVGDGRVELS